MIRVLAAKGGVGSTTLACHLSIELGKQSGGNVLVDLDDAGGRVGISHAEQIDYSLLEATKNPHRLDKTDYWHGIAGCESPHGGGCPPIAGGSRVRGTSRRASACCYVLRFAHTLLWIDRGPIWDALIRASMNLMDGITQALRGFFGRSRTA